MQIAEWDTSKHGDNRYVNQTFFCHNFLYVHDKLKRRGKSKPSAQLVPILTGIKHSQQRPCHPQYIMFSVTYLEEVRYPETTGRYFKGRGRRVHGTRRGRTHMLYSDFSGHGTETSK